MRDGSARCFNGYVTRFQHSGTVGRRHNYHAGVRPEYGLTRTADCRIFQDKTVPEIQQVFADHKVADVKSALTAAYRNAAIACNTVRRISTLSSRLLEQEGIDYFFTHTENQHTLVLADTASAHLPARVMKPCPTQTRRKQCAWSENISQWRQAFESPAWPV